MSQPAPIYNPQVPFSQEAEEAAIGSILVNPTAFHGVSAFLNAQDFYLLRHTRIWQAMLRLTERNEPIDYLTVAEELKIMKTLDEVGGYPYLIQLMNNTPTSVHAEIYGRLVERTSIRRRMMEHADKVRELALNEDENIETALDKGEASWLGVLPVFDKEAQKIDVLLDGFYDEFQQRLMGNAHLGFPTGFRDLDHLFGGLKPGEVTLIGGRPGSGKTSLLLSILLAMARMGLRCAMFELEMSLGALLNRLLSIESGINMQKIALGQLAPQEIARFTSVIGRLYELPIMLDDTPSMSITNFRKKVHRIKHFMGLEVVFIDYLQLMNGGGTAKGMSRQQELGLISRGLKQYAKDFNVHIMAGVQLNRELERRRDKRPQLSDLREAGDLEQDADNVAFIYRDEMYNEATEFPNQADIIVGKHRNGPTGTISLYFEKTLTKFMDANVHRVDLSDLE
jgi:replicative DNA helicase